MSFGLVWFGLVEQVLPDILKHHSAFILRDKRHYQDLSLKMKAPQNLKNSWKYSHIDKAALLRNLLQQNKSECFRRYKECS